MTIQQVIVDEPGEGVTNDASPTSIYSFVVPPDSSGYFRSIVCARKVSDGGAKQFTIDVGFKRVGTANAVITNYGANGFGTLNLDAYPDAVADAIHIMVTGLPAAQIEWSCVSRGVDTVHLP